MKKRALLPGPAVALILILAIMIIKEPQTCTNGAAEGLLLCGRVIIPALFPFTVCVLFILKSGVLRLFDFAAPFTSRVFHISPCMFTVMLLSFFGGYPIGAKLLSESVSEKKISPEAAGIMVNYCVNAGPAFVIVAVGSGIVGSKAVGYILLCSHIAASFILAFVFGFFFRDVPVAEWAESKKISATDNFVLSSADAASAVFGICSYVIMFSTVNSYLLALTGKTDLAKYLAAILEVTNGVRVTDNILIISFMLGFGGLCVWCQIFSLAKGIKINLPVFAVTRVFHGLVSVVLTSILLKIFRVAVTTFSSGEKFSFSGTYTTFALSLSMLCMVIILIISLYTKNCAGKILRDLV